MRHDAEQKKKQQQQQRNKIQLKMLIFHSSLSLIKWIVYHIGREIQPLTK